MKTCKLLIFAILLLSLSGPVSAQADSTIYKVKIEQYQRMQKAGTGVMIGGAAVEAAGIGLLIYGFTRPEGVSDDPYVTPGYVCMGLGIVTALTGLIFRGTGTRKINEYQIKLNDTRASLNITPGPSGITLSYRF